VFRRGMGVGVQKGLNLGQNYIHSYSNRNGGDNNLDSKLRILQNIQKQLDGKQGGSFTMADGNWLKWDHRKPMGRKAKKSRRSMVRREQSPRLSIDNNIDVLRRRFLASIRNRQLVHPTQETQIHKGLESIG